MNKNSMSVIIVVLNLLFSPQVWSMQSGLCDIKLLEYDKNIRGKSLLAQNSFYLPAKAFVQQKEKERDASITCSIRKGLSGSVFKELFLPSEQYQLLQLTPTLFKRLNKQLYHAVENIEMKNMIYLYRSIQNKGDITEWGRYYIPLLVLVEDLKSRYSAIAITPESCCEIAHVTYIKITDFIGHAGRPESIGRKIKNPDLIGSIYKFISQQIKRINETELFISAIQNVSPMVQLVCDDVDNVLKNMTCYNGRKYVALMFGIKYFCHDKIFYGLLRELRRDALFPPYKYGSELRAENFCHLLRLTQQYNNDHALDILISADPYQLKRIHRNCYQKEYFLDMVRREGLLSVETVKKLFRNGY